MITVAPIIIAIPIRAKFLVFTLASSEKLETSKREITELIDTRKELEKSLLNRLLIIPLEYCQD